MLLVVEALDAVRCGVGQKSRQRVVVQGEVVVGVGHRAQQLVLPLAVGGRAEHVQPFGNQCAFDFNNLATQTRDFVVGIGPGRLGLAKIETGGLGLDDLGQPLGLGDMVRAALAPAGQAFLKIQPLTIKPGLGQRRRHVTDQCSRRAAFGQRALRRIIGRVQIDVGQITDQPVGPAFTGQPGLLARHEFQCAVGAEMQHRVGREILAQPAVISRKGVRGRKAMLEQQPHGIAFVAEGGLDADEHVAKTRTQDMDTPAVAVVLARSRAPGRLDRVQIGLAGHMIIDRNAGVYVGGCAVGLCVAADDGLA